MNMQPSLNFTLLLDSQIIHSGPVIHATWALMAQRFDPTAKVNWTFESDDGLFEPTAKVNWTLE